jgi:excisionase family DNA binding protein
MSNANDTVTLTPYLYKIPEVMRLLSMSRSVIYEQMRTGRLRFVKQGRATLVSASAIQAYVALLEQEQGSEVHYDETA